MLCPGNSLTQCRARVSAQFNTQEISLAVPQKVKQIITIRPSNSAPSYIPSELKIGTPTNTCAHVFINPTFIALFNFFCAETPNNQPSPTYHYYVGRLQMITVFYVPMRHLWNLLKKQSIPIGVCIMCECHGKKFYNHWSRQLGDLKSYRSHSHCSATQES